MTMAKTITESLEPHYHVDNDEARLAALCSAIDEGDASPDVVGFDPEAFIQDWKKCRSL